MDNKVLMLVVVIVCLVLGAVAGMYLPALVSPQAKNSVKIEAAVKDLSSKVIPSIVAYGKVTKISGKNITLAFGGDSVVIPVGEKSTVYSLAVPAGQAGSPTQQKVEFSQIKVGDNLNISLKLSSDGKLEGQSVIILPATKK